MLTWNVFIEDFNKKRIEVHNVFEHGRFLEDCKRALKKHGNNREQFAKEIRSDLMYYYCSKCEWEIVLTSWPQRKYFEDKKIDVYEQVMLNWQRFIDYVWNNRAELTL